MSLKWNHTSIFILLSAFVVTDLSNHAGKCNKNKIYRISIGITLSFIIHFKNLKEMRNKKRSRTQENKLVFEQKAFNMLEN